ncbi:hypothetical protein Acsp01_65230 [Actinoplanes sp. NBRC 101535]|nr:hypothetical protein Acsp01_65230 [Actinoplanes sp. NBRC 101535]
MRDQSNACTIEAQAMPVCGEPAACRGRVEIPEGRMPAGINPPDPSPPDPSPPVPRPSDPRSLELVPAEPTMQKAYPD